VHCVYERARSGASFLDPNSAAVEARCLLGCCKAAACNYECADSEPAECGDFGWSIPKAAVLREHRPAFASAELEPLHVRHLLVTMAEDLVMSA
jgi:hypothetical protein